MTVGTGFPPIFSYGNGRSRNAAANAILNITSSEHALGISPAFLGTRSPCVSYDRQTTVVHHARHNNLQRLLSAANNTLAIAASTDRALLAERPAVLILVAEGSISSAFRVQPRKQTPSQQAQIAHCLQRGQQSIFSLQKGSEEGSGGGCKTPATIVQPTKE
nr:hypothetical protein Iba_chr08eCG9020 [Ipomoea batatas]